MLFNDVPLRTRKALTPETMYSESAYQGRESVSEKKSDII